MSLTTSDLDSRLRLRIGNPNWNEVSDRDLMLYLEGQLVWLAALLEFPSLNGTLLLQPNQQFYPLPSNFSQLIDFQWNNQNLQLGSIFQFDRDSTNWQSPSIVPASNPLQVFILGRQLGLYPAPSASACATAPEATYLYFSSAMAIQQSGNATPQLADDEQLILVYKAAAEYWGNHADLDPSGSKRQQNEAKAAELIGLAKERRLNAMIEFYPRARVEVRRAGAAR